MGIVQGALTPGFACAHCCAARRAVEGLAHLCHQAEGELEQIQLLLDQTIAATALLRAPARCSAIGVGHASSARRTVP